MAELSEEIDSAEKLEEFAALRRAIDMEYKPFVAGAKALREVAELQAKLAVARKEGEWMKFLVMIFSFLLFYSWVLV